MRARWLSCPNQPSGGAFCQRLDARDREERGWTACETVLALPGSPSAKVKLLPLAARLLVRQSGRLLPYPIERGAE